MGTFMRVTYRQVLETQVSTILYGQIIILIPYLTMVHNLAANATMHI